MRLALYTTILLTITSCIDFSLSEKELEDAFIDQDLKPELETLIIGDRTIGYVSIDQGNDCLVVFVHGSPGSWSAFIDFFKNDSLLRSVDMLAIDRPGFGNSDRGWAEPSMELQAHYLAQVVRQFPHPQKILIGHSLGGPVIARIAMDYPDLADGLLFIAPSIDPELEKYEWYRTWIRTKVIGAITPGDFYVSNEEIMPLKDELEIMLPLWEKIKIPSLVIQGKNDVLVPWQNGEFAASMIADSLIEIRYLSGVNHFIPWTDPDQIILGIYDLQKTIGSFITHNDH